MSNPNFDYPALKKHGIESADFDSFGLRWPSDHLDLMYPGIVFCPIMEMAKYVDRVVFEIVVKNNPEEIELLKQVAAIKTSKVEINTTMIGNIAFIAMYCKESNIKAQAFQTLGMLQSKIISTISVLDNAKFGKPTATA